jgi:hypothetical protein
MERSAAYEAAALQALLALQEIYGFVVLDYSIHSLVLYRTLAQHLFPIANRGLQLARFLISSSQQGVQHDSDLLACARGLVHGQCLDTLKSALCKKKFPITSNLRYIYRVLNMDKIKN